MTAAFLLWSLALFVPVWPRPFRLDKLVVGAAANFGFQALLAAFLHGKMEFGWTKWLVVVVVGGLLARRVACLIDLPKIREPRASRWWIPFTLLLAWFVVENAWILGAQGWGSGDEPYFRPPFQNDGQRHVVLIAALLRGDESPFLPGFRLIYQLLWYHLAAVYAALFNGPTLQPVVQGMTLGTSLLFALTLLWSLRRARPALFTRGGLWLWALLIPFAHTDLYHAILGLLTTGVPGLEADWSLPQGYFRNFSLKLVALTCPQHAIFFAFLAVFLATRASLFLCFCVVSSPVLSIFFFPIYFFVETVLRWRARVTLSAWVGEWMVTVTAGVIVHRLAFGFWPLVLFQRPGNVGVNWLAGLAEWRTLPLTWIAAAGVPGVLALFALWAALRSQGKRVLLSWEAGLFVGGTLVFFFVATGVEVRRHFAMVACFSAAFCIAKFLPVARSWGRSREGRLAMAGLALVSVPLHVYFLYSYLGKPSFVEAGVAWKDYFAMNEVLRRKYNGKPVLAAAGLERWGWELPLAMEAATSYSQAYHAAVHVQLTPSLLNLMTLMQATKETMPFARRLGYHAVVWGPIEEAEWGRRVRERFLGEKLAQTGAVALYRIEDSWRKIFEQEKKRGGNYTYRLAKKLMAEGWRAEALEAFAASLNVDPGLGSAHMEMARIWYSLGATAAAAHHFRRAQVGGTP